MESNFRTGLFILVVSVVTLVIGSIVFLPVATKYAANKESEIKSKVESGDYTVYYNGQEVDPETVDIFMYQYKVDDEKKAVYLTDKQPYTGTRTNTLPVIIPVYS